MKNENILANIKSKSLKEARDEINEILNKLESKDTDLASSIDDYQRLIQLNKKINLMFKKKVKEISLINIKIKKELINF
jgi:exonuclease VII small subunit